MAKNPPHKAKNKPVKPLQWSFEQLGQQANDWMQQGQYKKAIEGYKTLLKAAKMPPASPNTTQNTAQPTEQPTKQPTIQQLKQWTEQLAVSYRHRADELANKDMVTEALACYDNIESLTGQYPNIEMAAKWLNQSHNWPKVTHFYLTYQHNDTVCQYLAPVVGCQILLNNQNVIELITSANIDTNSPTAQLWKQSQIAQQIITAWCQQDDTQVTTLLKQLPFRSAFKDLAKVFKALLLWQSNHGQSNHGQSNHGQSNHGQSNHEQSNHEKALALWQSIDKHSPFYGFATDLSAIYRFEPADQQTLLHHTHTNPVLFAVKDWSKTTIEQYRALQSYTQNAQNAQTATQTSQTFKQKPALALLKTVSKSLPTNVIEQLNAAIFYHAKTNIDDKRFTHIPKKERLRLCALQSMADNNLYNETEDWLEYLDYCNPSFKAAGQPQNRLVTAVVYQYLADQHQNVQSPSTREFLQNSIDAKPSEKALEQLFGLPKASRLPLFDQFVNVAINAFPKHIGFLKKAIQLAVDTNDHTNTLNMTQRLLQLDPVNPFARQTLINCHLAYAQTLLSELSNSAKKSTFEKELSLALSYRPEGFQLSRYQLLQILGYWTFGDKKHIQYWVNEALGTLHTPLAIRLGLLIEGQGIQISSRAISKYLAPIAKTVDISEIEHLLVFARYLQDAGFIKPVDIPASLLTLVVKTLKQSEAIPQVVQCCQQLGELTLYSAIAQITRVSLKRDFHPLLRFYQLYALAEGDPRKVSGSYRHSPNLFELRLLVDSTKQSASDALGNRVIKAFIARVEGCLSISPFSLPWEDEDEEEEEEEEGLYDWTFPDDTLHGKDDSAQIDAIAELAELFDPLAVLERMLADHQLDDKSKKALLQILGELPKLPF